MWCGFFFCLLFCSVLFFHQDFWKEQTGMLDSTLPSFRPGILEYRKQAFSDDSLEADTLYFPLITKGVWEHMCV